MNKKLKNLLIFVSLIIFFFIVMGLLYGWFFPAKPSVIIFMTQNTTEIKGFAYSKYPGSLACIACDGFYVKVRVFYNNTLICDSENSLISLGYATIPVPCKKEFVNYENKLVKVEADGKINVLGQKEIESHDEKILNLTFIKK